MTTSTPPDNTVLVLSPPMVNGRTEDVIGAHIGLRLAVYDLIDGAIVLVDPPLSGTMDPGDIMELWLENELAALDSKTIVDPNVRTTLRIPKGRLHPDRVNKLYYTVRRGSANRGTSTPSLEILYNRIRPGFKDRLTDPGGHSELKLLLPDVIKDGVGPDFVSAEVCVAYPYCRAYDLITLKCNGELLDPKPKVNPNQAPQPPNPGDEPPITICFTITRAYLDKAKRLDKKLHFSYTVTDQIGNGPDTDAPWSPVHSVDEDLDGVLLPMPILLERKEDYPGDDASIIDLEKLAGNPLLLVVMTKDNRFAVGDEIVATYTTTGQTDPVVVLGKVEADPFIGKLPCFLEVPNEKVFAGSKVTANYEVHRAGVGLVGNSQPANAKVTGMRMELKPPSIKEAPNGTSLDPFAAKDTLTALISEFPNMIGTQITVFWRGAAEPGSTTVGPIPVTTEGELSIPLNNDVVAFNFDKMVTVTYSVTANNSPQPSLPLNLLVQGIADGDTKLPKPTIDEAVGDTLDMNALTGNESLRIEKWPLQLTGQCKWLCYDGFDKSGEPLSKLIWQGEPHNYDNGLKEEAPITWLRELKDGSPMTITFKINWDGVPSLTTTTTFPTQTYNIKAIELPTKEDFDYFPWSSYIIKPGESLEAKSMLITNLPESEGSARINESPQFPGQMEGKALGTSNDKLRIRLDLKGTYSRVSFWCSHTSAMNTATSYNDSGTIIETINIARDQFNAKQAFFTKPGIKRIEIENGRDPSTYDLFYIDSFEFTV